MNAIGYSGGRGLRVKLETRLVGNIEKEFKHYLKFPASKL